MSEYIGYSEQELAPAIQEFERKLGGLVKYVINNFREGDALKFNYYGLKPEQDRKEDPKFKMFD